MSMQLSSALELAARGFHVFPCWPDSKRPAFPKNEGGPSRWQSFATSEPIALAEKWFENPRFNPAIFTRGMVVIDVDTHKGIPLETFTSLGPVPMTFTVRTARGGFHYYFKTDEAFSNSSGALPKGIDVRGHGGLVLGPGATFEGGTYEVVDDRDPAPLPAWLAAMLRTVVTSTSAPGAMLGEVDSDAAIERAKVYIAQQAPAVEGMGGDDHTYKICAHLRRDLNLSIDTALGLLEPWNDSCVPPWDSEDLTRKLENAGQYGQNLAGTDNPLVGFKPIEAPPSKSRLIFASDISLEALRKRSESALVEGLCHRGDLGVFFGDSTAGKSFVALDLAFAIALGEPWHGRRTQRGPVLYLCMEGGGGFQLRVMACKDTHGDPGARFAMVPGTISLSKDKLGDGGLREIIAAIRELERAASEPIAAVVVDTLQRAMGGDDENDTADMARFVARLGTIQTETGAAVIVCHHTNAQGKIRGSTVLFASSDFVVRIEKDRSRRRATAEKVKDGSEGPLFSFDLTEVDLGSDCAGKHFTSAVLTPVASASSVHAPAQATSEKKYVRVFREAATECLPPNPHNLTGPVEISASDVESAFREKYPTGQSDERKRKATLDRYWRTIASTPPSGFEIAKIAGGDVFIWIDPPS